MKLHTILTGYFKLDGGAMFGVVPRQMWQRIYSPDENNMITWAMRCLLIETGGRLILVDTGIGYKQDDKFRSHFEPHGSESLIDSIEKAGFTADDITDVFLTHLHFDHCGGAVGLSEEGNYFATFKNANYWSNERHFNWAMEPNPRERASFLKENFEPLQKMGRLQFINTEDESEWLPNIRIKYLFGHTEAMMMLLINIQNQTLVYCADLIPSSGHVGLPYVMAYDIRPLETLKEKEWLLARAVEEKYILYFEHDPETECATILRNDRGRYKIDEKFNLKDLFPSGV